MPSKAAASVALVAVLTSFWTSADAFTAPLSHPRVPSSTPRALAPSLAATSDPAAAMSEYMAKSHEEKLRAVKDAEDKKNVEIQALRKEIDGLKVGGAAPTDPAAAISEYMAKVHEEKLRAVKDAEDKKNAEIQALRKELAASSGAAAPPFASPGSTTDLEMKLESYQTFMAEYIVSAQNTKLLAVKEAELAAEKKFQERLEREFGAAKKELPPPASVPATEKAATKEIPLPAPVPVTEKAATAFDERNAQVVAASAAGKSRWGKAEVDRALKESDAAAVPAAPKESAPAATKEPVPTAPKKSPPAAAKEPVPVAEKKSGPAPTAADPLKTEERVNLGANLDPSNLGADLELELSLRPMYDARNAQVVAAGKAGKSRWGAAEVERAAGNLKLPEAVNGGSSPTPAAVPVPVASPAVSWTTMGAVSIEDRINLGSSLKSEY